MDNVACDCTVEEATEDEFTKRGDSRSASSSTGITIRETVDFGKVAVGKKACKSFKIPNTSSVTRRYCVQYDPNVNPIFRTFDFVCNRTVNPGQTFECKITYKPLYPSHLNVDYLFVQEKSHQNVFRVSLRGESVGPSVEVSTNHLTFSTYGKKRSVEQVIELTNTSDVEAVYHFDVTGSKIGLYTLSVCRGVIPPQKSAFVTITFVPKQHGMYYEKLPLLILYHRPVIVYLLGFYTKEKVHENEALVMHYNFDVSEKYSYGGYLYDAMTVMKNVPPASLTEYCINFEGIDLDGKKDSGTSKTLATSLTNHMSEQIVVEWYHENGDFSITPKASRIHAYDSKLFECTFSPKSEHQFYHEILTAGVYWVDVRRRSGGESLYVTVPIPIQLRLLGHSFPPDKRWIPQLTMPETIVLPPCFAFSTTHTTFVLRVNGYLPVSYRFLPPKKSFGKITVGMVQCLNRVLKNVKAYSTTRGFVQQQRNKQTLELYVLVEKQFVLKPTMGVITDYQIIVVYFRCGDDDKKAFVEQWGVELNGMSSHCRWLLIKTYCEQPSVKIGTKNSIRFRTIHPQCEEHEYVKMHNNSVHSVKYKFHLRPEHSLLRVDYPEGTLTSNETITLLWTMTGKLNSPTAYTIICELLAMQESATSGTPFEIPVRVYTDCSYSLLCSMPTKCQFGKIEVGMEHTFRFHLFNFGLSTVHFNLLFWDKKKTIFNERCMDVIPSRGSLLPKEKKEVLISLHCKCSGNFHVCIYYQTRLCADSARIIHGEEIHQVFAFKFSSSYPTIQIVDINDHNFGPLFSKSALWNLFRIDKINNHLRTMRYKETRNMSVYLPESQLGEETFEAVWVLKNTSMFDTSMSLKRQRMCDCPLLERATGLTFRGLAYDCKHRSIFSMSLSGDVFQAGAHQTLTIQVHYFERGITHMCYNIKLSHARTLNCNVFVNTLPENVRWPSKYLHNFHMELGIVSVDDDLPPVKAFWLYNNSSNQVSYALTVYEDDKHIQMAGYKILQCLNPCGELLPFTTSPILFRFCPLECKQYTFTFPIQMGDHSYQFHLSGLGGSRYRETGYTLVLPEKSNMRPLDHIIFSEEHIIVRPLLVWSKTETVFFIKNVSKDHIIGYAFDKALVEGIVEVTVTHPRGVLKPKECRMMLIQILSFDQPCSMTIQLPCKFLDHTTYYLHKQTMLLHAMKEEQIKEEFTITEKGIEYPTNDVVITPMPTNFYKTMSLQIEVLGLNYIDEIMDTETQLFQYPQYLLNLDYSGIAKTVKPEELENPIISFQTLKNIAKEAGDNKAKIRDTNNLKIENVDLIKDTVNCLIRSALESSIFCDLLKERAQLPPPYYVQFKGDESLKYKEDVERKEKLIEGSLKTMQAPLMTEILQQLIMDGLHNIFQLGAQGKDRVDVNYIYMEQFKCSTCTDNKCNK